MRDGRAVREPGQEEDLAAIAGGRLHSGVQNAWFENASRSQRGLVSGGSRIKVLARGELGKALTVRAHKFSGKAADKIAAAGGATETL